MIFSSYLVLPKVRKIQVEPFNNLIESDSNFTIRCIITANSPSEIEFLFRPRQSNKTISLMKMQSKLNKQFEWTSILSRRSSRENIGEYYCRTTNNSEHEANISVNIVCTCIMFFFWLLYIHYL